MTYRTKRYLRIGEMVAEVLHHLNFQVAGGNGEIVHGILRDGLGPAMEAKLEAAKGAGSATFSVVCSGQVLAKQIWATTNPERLARWITKQRRRIAREQKRAHEAELASVEIRPLASKRTESLPCLSKIVAESRNRIVCPKCGYDYRADWMIHDDSAGCDICVFCRNKELNGPFRDEA